MLTVSELVRLRQVDRGNIAQVRAVRAAIRHQGADRRPQVVQQ